MADEIAFYLIFHLYDGSHGDLWHSVFGQAQRFGHILMIDHVALHFGLDQLPVNHIVGYGFEFD